jgi:hypothetical protein
VSTLRRLEAGDLRASKELAGSLAAALEIPPDQHEAFVHFARGHSAAFLQASSASLAQSYGAQPALGLSLAPPSSPNNLPAPLTSLVGRRREVSAICELLCEPGVRLVTLSGPPGAGKTRLSIAVADNLTAARSDLFPDGAHFVSLSPVRDSHLVASAVAQTLGVREQPGATGEHSPLQRALKEFLRSKQLLLVLDNFEQVVAAAPIVTDLLSAAPGVKVLVTSRELLHTYGEHEFPVPALPFPDAHHLPTILTHTTDGAPRRPDGRPARSLPTPAVPTRRD